MLVCCRWPNSNLPRCTRFHAVSLQRFGFCREGRRVVKQPSNAERAIGRGRNRFAHQRLLTANWYTTVSRVMTSHLYGLRFSLRRTCQQFWCKAFKSFLSLGPRHSGGECWAGLDFSNLSRRSSGYSEIYWWPLKWSWKFWNDGSSFL